MNCKKELHSIDENDFCPDFSKCFNCCKSECETCQRFLEAHKKSLENAEIMKYNQELEEQQKKDIVLQVEQLKTQNEYLQNQLNKMLSIVQQLNEKGIDIKI